MRKVARRRSLEEKQRILYDLEKHRASGGVLRDFFRENSLNPATIHGWRKQGVTAQESSEIPTTDLSADKPLSKYKQNKLKKSSGDFVCVAYGPRDVVERLLNLGGANA